MPNFSSPHVAVIGGGPAGLMAADVASAAGLRVTIFDRMPSVGRKFLMAGRGGLNLTHSEDLARFLQRYGDRTEALRPAIEALPPHAVRAWCESLGQPTFVGSSGRVFPGSMKTSPLLRAWLGQLAGRGVTVQTRHLWAGWTADANLAFSTREGPATVDADAAVLALGGASWTSLGSDGAWVDTLASTGVGIEPLMPANCGFTVAWSNVFRTRFEGTPLKRIAVSHGEETTRGEALLTSSGIEGGAIYAISSTLRRAITANGRAVVEIDLRPDIDRSELSRALAEPRHKQSMATFLRKAAQLSPAAIGLLQEYAHTVGMPLAAQTAEALATTIKALPIELTGMAPIGRAISTAGGVAFGEIDHNFMLSRRPGTFVAGEMLDWDAPTGGYLLQACLATGAAAGRGVLAWLAARDA